MSAKWPSRLAEMTYGELATELGELCDYIEEHSGLRYGQFGGPSFDTYPIREAIQRLRKMQLLSDAVDGRPPESERDRLERGGWPI